MAHQLAVFIENRPGSLAAVTATLADAGINIESIMVEGVHDFGVVRLQCSPLRAAEKALADGGFQFQTGDVLVIPMKNNPGELHDRIAKLAAARINVESVFGTTGPSGEAHMVLRVPNVELAKKALGL